MKNQDMKKLSMLLCSSIIWLVTAAIWFFILCLQLFNKSDFVLLMVMHGLCAGTSLAAGIVGLVRYKRYGKSLADNNDNNEKSNEE